MNEIVMAGVTMSSREIAELCGKRHDNVMSDCKKLIEFYGKTYSPEKSGEFVLDSNYVDASGRTLPCFELTREASLDIVTGYSLAHRHAVNKRWQELEARVGKAVDPLEALMDPALLRTLLLGYTQKVEGLSSTIALQAPKVAAFDRFATVTDGTYSLREAAKTLQVKPKWLIEWMTDRRWIYRHPDGGRWLAFQPRLDSHMLEHKAVTGQRNDGTDWGTTQVRVTAKGLARVAELLDRERAEGH